MGLAHEMKHAEDYYRGILQKNIAQPGPEGFPNMEEYNVVTGFETRLARLLGEDVRNYYSEMYWLFGKLKYFEASYFEVDDPTCKGTK